MDQELSNMMEGIEVKTEEEITTSFIDDISLTNEEEKVSNRTDKAEEYFLQTLELINNNIDFEKLCFIQKMIGVISGYHNEIYGHNNWKEYYINEGLYVKLFEINEIKEMMEYFMSFNNTDYNKYLILLKNIYVKMFIINECFQEYHHY